MKDAQQFFKDNNYVVIKNFLDPKIAALFYQYCVVRVQRTDFMIDNCPEVYSSIWDGGFNDGQVDNSFFAYGDPLMDSLLAMSVGDIEQYTGLGLSPTYTYWRFYQKGNILDRHVDRESCEISATLCLGYNVSNVDQTKYPNYNWPMFVADKKLGDLPVQLNPGDLIIYKGCEVEHWRDEFLGLNQAQMFMHFNDKNGPFKNVLDGRPLLGIPKLYQRKQ